MGSTAGWPWSSRIVELARHTHAIRVVNGHATYRHENKKHSSAGTKRTVQATGY